MKKRKHKFTQEKNTILRVIYEYFYSHLILNK